MTLPASYECHKKPIRPRLLCAEQKFSFLTFQCVRYLLRGLVEEALYPAPERHCQQRKQPKCGTISTACVDEPFEIALRDRCWFRVEESTELGTRSSSPEQVGLGERGKETRCRKKRAASRRFLGWGGKELLEHLCGARKRMAIQRT